MQLTGAQILIHSLLDMGVDTVFGYPGSAVLEIYDALYAQSGALRHVLTAHEQGAAHAADGYARSSGKTGVVIATSGPGATNLVTGLATAFQDSVPLVAITGNVPWDLIGRDSFQEVDIVGITTPIVKYNFLVRSTQELAGIVREAFVIANSGRKGPVLIDIPRDIAASMADYQPLGGFTVKKAPLPNEQQLDIAAKAIQAAKRPLIYCGGGVTFSDSGTLLAHFATTYEIPICQSLMGISGVPARHAMNLGLVGMHGTPSANFAVGECDVLLAVGARFSERVAGNRSSFAKKAQIIHIDIDDAEISKNIPADIPLVGDVQACLRALMQRLSPTAHTQWIQTLQAHEQNNRLPTQAAADQLTPRALLLALHELLGEDAIVATDVGQHQMFTAQFYPFEKPRTFLSSCGLGTMGYGLGAANGAAVANSQKRVALITGDGSFHMNMAELAVSVSENLPILILVMNNRILGMVHQWQGLFCEGRYSATEIGRKTDYAALANAFGAKGLRIETPQQISAVLRQAVACKGPCVVDCVIAQTQQVFPIIPPGGGAEDMITA